MGLLERSRDEEECCQVVLNMANNNYLMFLSTTAGHRYSSNRVFECKTCSRQFPSFQALGGHRASHKRPRMITNSLSSRPSHGPTTKPKTHECTVCGLEFGIGQALGGHMRRHRTAAVENAKPPVREAALQSPLLKISAGKRIVCLDLNLTPFENDLECSATVG